MPKIHLSSAFVKDATSAGKAREYYWDSEQPGFGLMVTASGARSFVIQYRNADGDTKRMKLDAKTLAKARAMAHGYIGEDGAVEKGRDPLADQSITGRLVIHSRVCAAAACGYIPTWDAAGYGDTGLARRGIDCTKRVDERGNGTNF